MREFCLTHLIASEKDAAERIFINKDGIVTVLTAISYLYQLCVLFEHRHNTWDKCCRPCLIDEESKAKREEVTCPGSQLVSGSFQFSSVAQSCPTLCNPMDYSTPGLPVHHQLLEFSQTHVHWVDDAIQPSRPLLSPSPPAFNLSQHQGLFKWVSSLHQVAKVLGFQL